MGRTARFFFIAAFQGATSIVPAHEGMWLPTVLGSIQDRMQAEGLELTAEDIYSANNGSLKDAIVLFGGGCTAEVISGDGLILTNHHCGFGSIQEHSALDHDYLKNGFWAMDRAAELKNPGLSATFIIRMEDVTEKMLATVPVGASEGERQQALATAGASFAKEAIAEGHYNAVVRAFNYGLQFILIISETFPDVRLVGAPPGAVGKFGGDTDNWMWPRHTGDFSMFRIYAGPDNKPADAGPGNVPFRPRHVLPIAMGGVREGDFAMIYGFPGNTQRYLTSYAVEHLMMRTDPARIAMRTASLGVIDRAMRASDRVRIQYADKQSGISNGWKKWIGELRGLRELEAVDLKRSQEAEFRQRAINQGRPDLVAVLDTLGAIYAKWSPYAHARDLFVEWAYYGPELVRFADRFKELEASHTAWRESGKLEAELVKLRAATEGFYKDFDARVDRDVCKALLPIYRERIDPVLAPAALTAIDQRSGGNVDAFVDDLYDRTLFTSKENVLALLARFDTRAAKKLSADPMSRLSRSFFDSFLNGVRPVHAALGERIESGMRNYVQGTMALFPEHTYWPDANSTLRLSYGKVEGSRPRDGVVYQAFSTLDGILEKYQPGDPEFDVPERLVELHQLRDYGRYAEAGSMPVCFTASLHTTGGNSGSPVINGRGELIGLNFDRSWESTMSDILFDPAKCRNIAVDIRYVLFVVDKLCGAGYLLEEMRFAPAEATLPIIDLPIHR
ncbi:MAG: S46 family peptidase [Flavobacteriales bacterium]|nr:S46 family peptidase [Flavobacteriales bacterium]